MEKVKLFFTALLVLAATSVAYAQKAEVTGTVTDEGTGETIPFASVRVKGTMTGASAGTDGTYRIKLDNAKEAVLVFSFVGYTTVEIPVNGKSIVNAALKVDATQLSDVVVVAYGTQKKESVTGSVSSVKGEGLADAPVTSVDKMLSGKLAGVQITATSGQPGATSQIRIRGNGSINATNAPLWVVDGIPIVSGDISQMTNTGSSLTMVNPNDIESITVLKDAAASAAYGSRAANGVILVTTKSGKEGTAQFDVRAKFGVSWLQSDSGFRVMNAKELLGYQRDAVKNAGMNPDDPTGTYYRPMNLLSGELTDWMSTDTRIGKLSEVELSARGGNSKSKYFSSFSYHKNDGVFYGVDYTKFQGRVNADYQLLKNFSTGVRLNVGYSEANDVPMQSLYHANPVFAGETLLPWIPAKNADGDWNIDIPSNSNQNPRATAAYDEQWDHNYRFNGTVNFTWTPFKNLVIDSKNSEEATFIDARRYWNPYNNEGVATLQTYKYNISQMTTSNTVTYSNLFGGYHSLRVVLGQEAMKYKTDSEYISAPGVNPDIPYPNTADQTKTEASVSFTNETMLSFFGIADYNFNNKYFAQATVREDGSSLFGADNKWGLFWSGSASWNVSNEKFFAPVKDIVSLLKLRASYGVNGNNGIDAYKAYGLYSSSAYNGYVGMLPSQPENKKLSWEKNKTWNVGVDFTLYDKVRTNVDVYSRKTVDMLLNKEIPQTTGFSSIFTNVGSMRNNGVEVQLDADIISTKDLLWTAGGNIAFNKTKILNLAGNDFLGTWARNVVGKSMYTYYVYDYYGVNPSNGEALWVTKDGTLTNNQAKARQYYAGSPEPKAIGGFNTAIQWKGFQFSTFFEFKTGNKVMIVNENRYLQSDGSYMNMNQMASALNYWKKPGDTGVNPKPVAGNSSDSNEPLSDRWLEDGSYLRLKDITLSYNLPKKATDFMHVKNFKVYVSGLNLYCFNDVNFWDPEMGVTGAGAGIYPLTKSFVGGIEVSF